MSASSISVSVVTSILTIPAARTANVGGLLLRAAQRHPDMGVGYITREGSLSTLKYPALLAEACRILGGLRERRLRRGTNVVLLLEHASDFIPAFWACVLGGYVPCPLSPIRNDPQRWAKHLSHIDALLERPSVITTSALLDPQLPPQTLELTALRQAAPAEPECTAEREDLAILMLTSGSTGNAKAVRLTHANLLASMHGKAERLKLTAADRMLNWIAFDHVAALLEVHLVSLYAGATQFHLDPASILADPLLFLRLIDRHRVTVTFSPNFLFGQINAAWTANTAAHGEDLDLSCLRAIVSGGEANVVETGRRFLHQLAPYGLAPTAIRPAFGMTETCAGSTYNDHFPVLDAASEFASVGLPITGMQMRIADEEGRRVPNGQPGELQLRGTMIFGAYHNNPEATRAAFTADGWFRSGDLGRLDAEGRLTLVGRSKDSIIVSGVNYFSHELETALESLPDIERAFVAVFPTRPPGSDTEQLAIAFATTFPVSDEARVHQLLVAVRSTCVLLWGFRPSVIVPLPKEAFPKTSLGKIQRSLLRKQLESGAFDARVREIAEITQRQLGGYVQPTEGMEHDIAAMFAEIFSLDPGVVSAAASFFDLGGTSLEILRLTRMLERRFDVHLTVATILQNPTVRQLAARIAARSASASAEYDPLVPMQLTGTKTPLFCVHPGIGEVLVFVNLAKYFVNDRPFYALRARGFEAGHSCFATFQEMVDAYVAAIRKCQPHGPYALAGYSLGAPIAVEIARVLEAQGQRVAFIGCIDGPPRSEVEPLDFTDIAFSLAFFLGLIDKSQLRTGPAGFRQRGADPCPALVAGAPPERLAELDLDLAKFQFWATLSHALNTLGAADVGADRVAPVDSVTVFHAEPLRFTAEDWMSRLEQWERCTRVPNRYFRVDGDHASMLGPQHVGAFQRLFRAEIDRAFAADAS